MNFRKISSPITSAFSIKRSSLSFKIIRSSFWFLFGATIGLFFFASFVYIYYKQSYEDKIYPGITIEEKNLGGMTQEEAKNYFSRKNQTTYDQTIILDSKERTATISASQLGIGYDESLLAAQAYSVGRSENLFSDIYLIFQSSINGIKLQPAYHYNEKKLDAVMLSFQEVINEEPIDARFNFENGKVTEFQTAKNGKQVDVDLLKKTILDEVITSSKEKNDKTLTLSVPVRTKEPEITNEEANDLGIKELIGKGSSLYQGSIVNRIYNLTLAASRMNGILVKPGEEFSFNKVIGDISTLSGYKQAYVIQNGRTVLGDGGGVCQVSTTLFRAILNAGLPITERNQHAYRVGYYEQDSAPGIDAAIYTPNIDLKFKNDTGHHILIQSYVEPGSSRLTFELYGTSDGRISVINKPVIVSQSPAPEPLYQDDPTLPKDAVKQVDWAAPGAVVYFTREVKRNGETIISDTFNSRYRPWQAVYLKGTKEG